MNYRFLAVIVADLIMTAAAVMISFFLRWGAAEFWARLDVISLVCAMVMPVAGVTYWVARLHRRPWKFVSITDVTTIAFASLVPAVALAVIDFVSGGALLVPRTVPAIFWLVQVFALSGARTLYRAYRSRRNERKAFQGVYRVPVLIAGTGYEAEQLIRRLQRDAVTAMQPVGLLTSKPRQLGERIQDVPVVGLFTELEQALEDLHARSIKPRRIILTSDSLRAGDAVDHLIGAAQRLGIATLRSSRVLTEASQDPVQLAPISLDDLLGRSTRDFDLTSLRTFITGRRVVVTGAGGSIGSELCRQIAAMEPAALMLFEQSEFALYSIAKEMRRRHKDLTLEAHLGSVADPTDVLDTFREFRPELVFHAAALKHVDITEQHPVAATHTNALGTRYVAEAAMQVDAACAVFISTDKAVNPVSVLGASKRAGELYWATSDRLSREMGRRTRFLAVRFGNVLGSSGSVIPLFAEQLKAGGPITITHPEVERYFMTISEAVTLVLLASAEGVKSTESSPLYVLDMGKPVKILDLARRMIRLAGLEPDRDIDIVFTGLRPGERLSEALEYTGEELRPTAIAGVQATDSRPIEARILQAHFAALEEGVAKRDEEGLRRTLSALVPEYRPPRSLPRGASADLRHSA